MTTVAEQFENLRSLKDAENYNEIANQVFQSFIDSNVHPKDIIVLLRENIREHNLIFNLNVIPSYKAMFEFWSANPEYKEWLDNYIKGK